MSLLLLGQLSALLMVASGAWAQASSVAEGPTTVATEDAAPPAAPPPTVQPMSTEPTAPVIYPSAVSSPVPPQPPAAQPRRPTPMAEPAAPCPPQRPAVAAPSTFQPRVLFGALEDVEHGGYGVFAMRVSEMRGRSALLIGGRGGWLIDHHLVIGGGGYGQVLPIRTTVGEAASATKAYLEFGYGGAFVGYHIAPEMLVHAVVGSIIGAGALAHSQRDGEAPPVDPEGDAVFVLEPSIDLEMNLFTMLRLQVGVSYRWVRGTNLPGTDNSDVSGLAFGVGVAAGLF